MYFGPSVCLFPPFDSFPQSLGRLLRKWYHHCKDLFWKLWSILFVCQALFWALYDINLYLKWKSVHAIWQQRGLRPERGRHEEAGHWRRKSHSPKQQAGLPSWRECCPVTHCEREFKARALHLCTGGPRRSRLPAVRNGTQGWGAGLPRPADWTPLLTGGAPGVPSWGPCPPSACHPWRRLVGN